jgi:hypothetical protein
VRLFKIQIPCKLLYHYNLLSFFICVFNGTLFHMKEFDDLMLILCDVLVVFAFPIKINKNTYGTYYLNNRQT